MGRYEREKETPKYGGNTVGLAILPLHIFRNYFFCEYTFIQLGKF